VRFCLFSRIFHKQHRIYLAFNALYFSQKLKTLTYPTIHSSVNSSCGRRPKEASRALIASPCRALAQRRRKPGGNGSTAKAGPRPVFGPFHASTLQRFNDLPMQGRRSTVKELLRPYHAPEVVPKDKNENNFEHKFWPGRCTSKNATVRQRGNANCTNWAAP